MSIIYPDQRVIRTRSRLKCSLLETICDPMTENLTVAHVCKLAGVNRTTFYHHFNSIEDLINQLLEEVVTEIITAYRKPYTEKTSFHLQDLHFTEITLFHSIIHNRETLTKIVCSPILPQFQQRLTESIKNIMFSDLSQSGNVDHELFVVYHSTAITALIIYWIESGYTRTPDEMSEQLLSIVRLQTDQRLHVKTILSPMLIELNRKATAESNLAVKN